MGQRLRTPIPQHPSLLMPDFHDQDVVAGKERERRLKDTLTFNKRHRVRDLSQLTPGQDVWVKDVKTPGTLVSSHSTPRSYLMDSPSGTIRRNRQHLVSLPENTFHTETLSTRFLAFHNIFSPVLCAPAAGKHLCRALRGTTFLIPLPPTPGGFLTIIPPPPA